MKAYPTRPVLGLALALLGWALAANPARAEVHGGIEIGARGVKATVLDVTGGADGYAVKVLLSGTKNTQIVTGLASSGRFDARALQDTVAAVAKFAAQMDKEYHVPAERLHVVGSSGLFSAILDKPDAIKANEDLLASAVRDACGLKMTFIDVKREVELSVAGTVPPRDADRAVLLDIGGGNTKGGYCEPGKGCVSFGIPYGSVTFTDRVKKADKGTFAENAEALRQEVLAPALKKAVEGKPELTQRPRVYLSGGACWALATLMHPGDRSGYVALSADDIDAYRKRIVAAGGDFPAPDLATILDPEVREAARKEIGQVKDVFKPEQLLAGAEILKALSDEFGFGKDKKVCFVRHAQVAWILAYVAEKATAPK
jgi:exopolyphosphatase/pppGpp-phosphohydrolase